MFHNDFDLECEVDSTCDALPSATSCPMVARLREFDIFSMFVLTATVIATRQGIKNENQMKYHHGQLWDIQYHIKLHY